MEHIKTTRAILSNKNYATLADKINAIKIKIDPGFYKESLKTTPLLSHFLHKNPFFYTLDDVRIKEPFQFTKDFKKEFKWITNIIENYYPQINSFMELKSKFENSILIENYSKATEILIEIENSFGISLWSIEANFLILQLSSGSESNWNKLTEYLKIIKNSVYEFNISNSSRRVESDLSYESFFNQFQNDIDSISASTFLKDFFVFKNFNLADYDYTFKNLESVLYVSNIFSIVDQYLILIDVLVYHTSKSDNFDKLILPFIKKAKEIIPFDFRLVNLYNTINDQNEFIVLEKTDKFTECINYYYSGDFKNSLSLSKNLIEENPMEFEMYEIYCKSLISLNINFQHTSISNLIDKILNNIFLLLSFEKQNENSFKELLKSALVLMNTNFGKQIISLLSEVSGDTKKHFLIGALSTSFNTCKNLHFLVFRKSIANKFEKILFSHSYKVYGYKLGLDYNFTNQISICEIQNTFLDASRNFFLKEYKNVIEILNQTGNDIHFYYLEKKYSLLFYSYINLNLLKEALVLYSNVFFDSLIVTRKLEYYELYEKLKKEDIKEDIKCLIEYPILMSMITKEYDLYEIYDDFMTENNLINIREIDLNEFLEKFDRTKTVYFLNSVATMDTIKYSTDYGSISEVEEDRVYILKNLIELDVSNKLNYEKEIEEIYKVNSVRKVLKEVDEGRLYIDVKNLKEVQIKKFKEDFKRYKEIEISSLNQSLIGFNSSNAKNWELTINDKPETIEKYNSADYLAFKSIYLESRENFLYSKEYGLDSCLSTRIRHGALKNHIRSVFEKLDLVTLRNKEKYNENELWKNSLQNYPELNIIVQEKLKEFSKTLDNYTIEIVDNLIQIQTEKKSEKKSGLFQYYTNDELLHKFYTEHKSILNSVENTVDLILTNLINYTLIQIQKTIVDFFKKDIPNYYQNKIDILINELRELSLPSNCQLIPNLTKSSTEIQNELDYISEWFYLNTTSSSSLLGIETIINASLNLTNRINPLNSLNPEIIVKINFAGYSNLIFVFNILFKNVIEHSKLETNKINLKIEIDILKIDAQKSKKYISVKFTNNLNPNFDYSDNLKKLDAVKDNWNNHGNIERSNKEGESGYDKIKRILLYESLAKTELFEYKLCNNEISITLFFPYNKPLNDE